MYTLSSRFGTQNSRTARIVSLAGAGALLMVLLGGMPRAACASEAAKPFTGSWDLTLPNGAAGWLAVTEKDDKLHASILWRAGSVGPVDAAKVEDGQLLLVRVLRTDRKNAAGKTVQATVAQNITARAEGDTLRLTMSETTADGKSTAPVEFSGKRTPPLPPAPSLSNVKFGDPIVLLNGKDLFGWKLTDPNQASGWSVEDGVLVNRIAQEQGKPHKSYGNLRTEQEFDDFNLTLETRVPGQGNSGIYLRGIYEVQVCDSYGQRLNPHNMGAIYSRICPATAAEKPAGQWQSLDITLVDRHVTVILNGTKIIDNLPLLGCTGGALWSDQLRPGPLYLQGDHTGIEYRNLVLRPVVK